MAGKGYGADATLVAAAYRLGQSNVPGDYSKIFEKQYEGLIAANKAKAQASIDFSKNLTEKVGDFMEFKKAKEEEDEEVVDNFKKLNEIGNGYTDNVAGEFATDMEEGNSLPPLHVVAAETIVENLASDYESLSNINFPSSQQRKDKKALKKQMLEFRPAVIKSRALQSTKATLWNSGEINKDQAFKGEPNLQALYSLSIDKNKTTEQLKKMGVTAFWENNKKYYEYQDGLYGAIYGDISNGGSEGVDVIPAGDKKSYKISETDLLARLQPKAKKSEQDLNTVQTALLKDINKTTTNPENNAKVRTIKDFNSVAGKIEKDFYDIARLSENPNDLYTSEKMVGLTPLVYVDDLQSNRTIGATVIEQMGLTGVFTQDELESGGGIDPAELEKYGDAKKQAMEILTNPKTSIQKDIAAREYAKYRKDMLEKVFNDERTRIDGAVKIETTEEKTRRLQAYEQNSIAIQTKFKEAEKQGFTYENLQGLPINKKMHFVKQDGKVYLAYKTSQGKDIKLVYNNPIDLKNKKQVLNILYSNSEIRPNEQNIKVTSADLTAASNPITDYEKRGDDWYYIKGGKDNKVTNKKSIELINAKAKIAEIQGKQ